MTAPTTNEIDLAAFRVPVEVEFDSPQTRKSSKPPRHQPGEHFLKGPIPWAWLQRAMKLPGKALHVAMLLWKEAGIRRDRTVRLNLSAAEKNGVPTDTARRALEALEAGGLVSVTRRQGMASEVTLLDAPGRAETPA